MKKIKYLIFALFLFPINMYALSFNCPSKAESGAKFTCTIFHDSNSMSILSAVLDLPNGFSFDDVKLQSGYKYTGSGYNLSFSYQKSNGYNAPTKIAVLYFTAPTIYTKTTYNISLKNIKFKFLNTDSYFTNDTDKTRSIVINASKDQPPTTTTVVKNEEKTPSVDLLKLVLDYNDGSGNVRNYSCEKGSNACTFSLSSIEKPVKGGKDFIGWSDNIECDGELFNDNYLIEKDTTLYACFDESSEINFLSSLVIEGVDLEFKREIFEYTINVEELDELKVEAVAENENAKVKISSTKLTNGNNTIVIDVSYNNNITSYKLFVNNKNKYLIPPKLKSLNIKDYSITFVDDVFDYNVVVDYDVKSLAIDVVPYDEILKYEILGNDNLENNSIISIIVTNPYNGEKKNYTINVTKNNFFKTYFYNIYSICVVAFCIIVYFVVKIIRKKNAKKEISTEGVKNSK